ncbi:MAG: tetratricopeptide repeat protein [Candidatus Aquicultorales bacterium]
MTSSEVTRSVPLKKLLIGILAIAVLAAATAFVINKRNEGIENRRKQLYSESVDAFSKGNFDPAIVKLEEAAQINPDDPKPQQLLGRAYEAKGKLDKALTAYKASLKADPKQPEVLYSIAVIYKSQGKIDDAVSELKAAVSINKEFVAARLLLGDLYAQQGEKDQAKAEYEAVIKMKPFGVDLKSVETRIDKL